MNKRNYATFREALAASLRPDEKARQALDDYRDYSIDTADDAEALCHALRDSPRQPGPHSIRGTLLSYFQQVGTEEAADVLRAEGIPLLIRQVKQDLDREMTDYYDVSDLLFSLKILAMTKDPAAVHLVTRAARKPVKPDGYMWSVILAMFDPEHPLAPEMMRRLSDPLPDQFIAVSLLDAANRLARESDLRPHPFNSPDGHRRLEGWLSDPDPDHFSYAHSATASLPFISQPARDRLMALAMDHPDAGVQMQAAWAAAALGSEAGIKLLARFAEDVRLSSVACHYLDELGRADAIPALARNEDFAAMAEMCNWLSHPNEFGRMPDEITLFDSREMYWPPTNDRRRVWLFKYRYKADPMKEGEEQAEEPKDDVGLGMVGSKTFALFSETTADMSVEDVYALHCCWELQINDDPRAPTERTVEAGRAILQRHS